METQIIGRSPSAAGNGRMTKDSHGTPPPLELIKQRKLAGTRGESSFLYITGFRSPAVRITGPDNLQLPGRLSRDTERERKRDREKERKIGR